MATKIIQYHLIQDTTDKTALQQYTDNLEEDGSQQTYYDLGPAPTLAQAQAVVPRFHYTSLKTLLGVSDLSKYVVANPGDGTGRPGGGIWLSERLGLESTYSLESSRSDVTGAEFLFVDIIIGKDNQPLDDQVKNLDLRIRWILDQNIRQTSRRMGGLLDITDGTTVIDTVTVPVYIDPTIQDGNFSVDFYGYVMPPNAGLIAARYKVNYGRLFGR